jgi:HEPN domain-containing protein
MRRHADWFRQARRKLDSARWDIQGEFYMDFYDQPTAEEAVRLAESILGFVGAQL